MSLIYLGNLFFTLQAEKKTATSIYIEGEHVSEK